MSALPSLTLTLPGGASRDFELVPAEAFTAPPAHAVLAAGDGLAYRFAHPTRAAFWTLGFEAPVDQVFVADDGRIVQVFEARPPGEDDLRGPASDVVLVLELAAHEARRLELLPGAVLAGPAGFFDADADPGCIVMVQCDRAGWFLACELRRRGYLIAHVHDTVHLDEVGEDEFDLELVFGDDLDDVLPALHELGPRAVLAGSELGVNAADYLAEALELPGNGTLLSVARRDKAGMIEALGAAGIPVMRQLRTRSWRRIVDWMRRKDLPEVVIKPLRSAGTDRVTIARTPRAVRAAVRAIVGVRNRLGLPEVGVVAQERLVGPELYLNSVSRAGRHAVSEIWLETKRPARDGSSRLPHAPRAPAAPFAYDTFELCPGDDVLAGYLTTWLERVLDALDVRWGPAHTELILTERGPRLIDFGARLDGVLLPALNEECIGKSPVQLTADAYLDPAAWARWRERPYRLLAHATMVVVDNPGAGVLRDDGGLRGLAALPTFHALRPRWEVGETVPATRDAFSYHAIVTLRDADADAVRRDYRRIRELERHGLLLDVTPTPPPVADHPTPLPPLPPDPRADARWAEALAEFGWATVRDPASGLIAHRRAEPDGVLLWVPRQRDALPLAALERLRTASDARRVVVDLAPGACVLPLCGAPLTVGAWDEATARALDVLGLTPTMHAQSPPFLELAPAPDPAAEGPPSDSAPDMAAGRVLVSPPSPALPDEVTAAFAALGSRRAARWPAALARAFPGDAALAVVTNGAGAALGLRHGGFVHVAVVSAHDAGDLARLAHALGRALQAPVVAPGTGISELPGGRRADLLPPLRWKRPAWCLHLDDLDGIADAVGDLRAPPRAPPTTHDRELADRFGRREHPLATWGGATVGQAYGRIPLWARTAMLFRELPGQPPHGVVPHAARIDLSALRALAARHDLLWVGWEPPPAGGEVIAEDGTVHSLAFDDEAVALHRAAELGLFPVHARWTHRKTHILDLNVNTIHESPTTAPPRIRLTPADALTPEDWLRLDELELARDPMTEPGDDLARSTLAWPRLAARALAHGLGAEVVCATSSDAHGLTAYLVCLLHDRVAWSLAGASHPRALQSDHATLLRWELIRHARARGCDIMDLFGAWDERHPLESTSWRPLSERRERELDPLAVYYPPTLAFFPS